MRRLLKIHYRQWQQKDGIFLRLSKITKLIKHVQKPNALSMPLYSSISY